MHEPGPAEIHTAIDVDALPTCIYPGPIYLSGWAAEHETDGGMTVYQSLPTEDAQKAAAELFSICRVHERAPPGRPIQQFFSSLRTPSTCQHLVVSLHPIHDVPAMS